MRRPVRFAITNSRLRSLADDATVRFHYRDNRTRELKTATLSAEQFIARFLHHVLPERFTKVRYSGLFSSSNRHRLEQARNLLAPQGPLSAEPPQPSPPHDSIIDTALPNSARCPDCGVGRLVLVEVIARPRRPRGKPP